MSKIKKVFTAIAGVIIALFLKTGKVFAEIQIPTETLYGPPRDPEEDYLWIKVLLIAVGVIAIPLVIAFGIIAYRKSKSKKMQNINQTQNPQVGEQQNQNDNNQKIQ
jgi:hypothetical protein